MNSYMRKIIYSVAILFSVIACFGFNVAYSNKAGTIVTMIDNSFSPATLMIKAGEKVTWVNKGENDHTVTSDNGLFNSGHISPGSSFSYTFTKPGTYKYSCTIHSFMFFGMKGKVIVE